MGYSNLLFVVNRRVAKWAMVREEVVDLGMDNVLHKLEACLQGRLPRAKKLAIWSPPPMGGLKFNMDGTTRGKLGLGIGGVLKDR